MVFRLEYRHCHTLVRRCCQASWRQPIATRCSLKDKRDYWYKEDILLAERNRRRSLKHRKQSINISVLSTKRVCFLASVTGGKVFLKLWALKQLLLEHSKQLIPESVWFKETKPTNNDYIMKRYPLTYSECCVVLKTRFKRIRYLLLEKAQCINILVVYTKGECLLKHRYIWNPIFVFS